MREGLRLVERQEVEDKIRLKAMREAAKVGIANIAAGHYISFDAAKALRARLSTLTAEMLGEGSSDRT